MQASLYGNTAGLSKHISTVAVIDGRSTADDDIERMGYSVVRRVSDVVISAMSMFDGQSPASNTMVMVPHADFTTVAVVQVDDGVYVEAGRLCVEYGESHCRKIIGASLKKECAKRGADPSLFDVPRDWPSGFSVKSEGKTVFEITSFKVEELCGGLIDILEVEEVIEKVLSKSNLKPKEVNHIILVGSFGKLQSLQDYFKEHLGNSNKLVREIDPNSILEEGIKAYTSLILNKKYTIKEKNPAIGYVFKDVSVQLFDGKLRTLIKSHQPLPASAQTTIEVEVLENMENYAIKIYEGDSPDAELNCEILKSYIKCPSFAGTKKLFVKLDVAVSKRYCLTLSASIVNFGSIKDMPDGKSMKTVVSTASLLPPPLNIDGNLLNPHKS